MSAEQDRLVRQQISSLLYSGDLVNAEAMCREHLKKRTRDHEALAMLAHVNFTIGQLQEAERVLTCHLARCQTSRLPGVDGRDTHELGPPS